MKKIFILALIATATVFSSCSQSLLDNPKKGSSTASLEGDEICQQLLVSAYFYLGNKDKDDATGMWNSLHRLYGLTTDEYCHDNYDVTSEGAQLEQYTFDAFNSEISCAWTSLWRIIIACNRVIVNFENGTTPLQKQCVAEATVLRAWCYMHLVQLWGCPPLIDNLPASLDEFTPYNSTAEDVWEFIKTTLASAINSGALPQKNGPDDKVARLTKEAALTMLGKAQIFTGEYENAKASLKQVVQSPNYRLLTGEELKTKFCGPSQGKLNSESLFEIYTEYVPSNVYFSTNGGWDGPNWIFDYSNFGVEPGCYLEKSLAGWIAYIPTKNFITEMLNNEGFSDRFKAWFVSYEDLLDWGLYNLETARNNGKQGRTAAIQTLLDKTNENVASVEGFVEGNTDGGQMSSCCGFYIRKFLLNFETDYPDGYVDYTSQGRLLMRLSEAYLLYAEACAMAGDSDGSGLAALNAIAARAGYAKGAGRYESLTLANVQNEKKYEMYGEFCRRNDLIRWNQAATVLTNQKPTKSFFYGYKAGKTGADIKADGSNIWDVYETRLYDWNKAKGKSATGFVAGKHEVFPFPNLEITNNPHLSQNSGY